MSTEKKIYGFHSITSQIRLDPVVVKEVFIDEARSDGRVNDLMKIIKTNDIKFHLSTKDRLDGMVSSNKHQGVVALVREAQNKYVTVEDIIEYLIAGATAIQVGTATFINPNAMVTLLADLESFLQKQNIQNISDLIGSVRDEDAADEVVFMETTP